MNSCEYVIYGVPGSRFEETCGDETDDGPYCRRHAYAMSDDSVDLYREMNHTG